MDAIREDRNRLVHFATAHRIFWVVLDQHLIIFICQIMDAVPLIMVDLEQGLVTRLRAIFRDIGQRYLHPIKKGG